MRSLSGCSLRRHTSPFNSPNQMMRNIGLATFSGAVHMPSHLIASLTRKMAGGGQTVDTEGRKETLIRTQERQGASSQM